MKLNVGKFSLWLNSQLHHYNEHKYWKMRSYVVQGEVTLLKLLYLYKIKRADAFNNVSMGTDLCSGAIAVIGDNCTLGAKSTIIGGVTIGNNVIVGANAVVTHDVPDNCVVAGVLAKIIKRLV